MSWISGNCQDDRHYSCTYEEINPPDIFNPARWCVDSDDRCYGFNDGGGLISAVDNWAPEDDGW
jgi:hypothetical protein